MTNPVVALANRLGRENPPKQYYVLLGERGVKVDPYGDKVTVEVHDTKTGERITCRKSEAADTLKWGIVCASPALLPVAARARLGDQIVRYEVADTFAIKPVPGIPERLITEDRSLGAGL